jgi:hypothetical protein
MRAIWELLVYVVLPLWVVSGFLDYLCHRRSHIERANGARESLIHWLMVGEVALPLLMAVFCQINALVISIMLAALAAHEITGYLDLRLAMATRQVTIFEHQVHSALEILPLTAILLVMALHWPQASALFGFGAEAADFTLRLKPPPWSRLLPPAAFFFVFILLPYAEETYRGWRNAHPPTRRVPDRKTTHPKRAQ